MSELVKVVKRDGIGEIIMNSPPANAISNELIDQLSDVLSGIKDDPGIRVVLVKSAVPRIFMAGADLKMLIRISREELASYMKRIQDVFSDLEALSQPTIAVIGGHALGGGCEIALCCDFRFMSAGEAKIGLPEVNLGIMPAGGGIQRLPLLVSRSKAKEMMISGKAISGEEAFQIGLVDKVFEPEDLVNMSVQFAGELAKKATRAIAEVKKCLQVRDRSPITMGLNQALKGITYLVKDTEDAMEGMAAFNEKRKPRYKGK